MAAHNDLGRWGEEMAAQYLEHKGYTVVERNWKWGHRDLDIVAIDAGCLVVVEVKTRRNQAFMAPEKAVDRRKIQSLCIAANAFVKLRHVGMPLRFDIITVTGTSTDDCEIDHIQEAFTPLAF